MTTGFTSSNQARAGYYAVSLSLAHPRGFYLLCTHTRVCLVCFNRVWCPSSCIRLLIFHLSADLCYVQTPLTSICYEFIAQQGVQQVYKNRKLTTNPHHLHISYSFLYDLLSNKSATNQSSGVSSLVDQ